MSDWNERPLEYLYLLNPAFCGFLIRRTVESYTNVNDTGLPYSLAFLVLPLVLHRATRETLPTQYRSSLIGWVQEFPQTQIGLADRTQGMVSFTKEALLFLGTKGYIRLDNSRILLGTERWSVTAAALQEITRMTDEIKDCERGSRFLGRWFAQSPNEETIYASLGMKL